jgi:hypothetical protein
VQPPLVSVTGPAIALVVVVDVDDLHLSHPAVDCVPTSPLQPQPQLAQDFLHRSIGTSVTFHIVVRSKNLLAAVNQHR